MHLKCLFTFTVISQGTYSAVKCMGFQVWQASAPVLASLLPICMALGKFLNHFELQFSHLTGIIPPDRVAMEMTVGSCQCKGSCGYFSKSMMVLYLFMASSNLFPNEVDSWTSAVIIVSVSLGLHTSFIFACGTVVGIVVRGGTWYFGTSRILLRGHRRQRTEAHGCKEHAHTTRWS